MEWNGVVKVRYESMVMVRRALVGDLNMLCKHAFLAGPCAGIGDIRGAFDKQVKSKLQRTSAMGEIPCKYLLGWTFNASSVDWKRRCLLTRE